MLCLTAVSPRDNLKGEVGGGGVGCSILCPNGFISKQVHVSYFMSLA